MILWIVFALFLVLSLLFLSGHGAFLIGGYNTASDEEKGKYDEKRLCRLMGACMSFGTLSFLVLALLQDKLPAWALGVWIFATVLIMVPVAWVLLNAFGTKND